MPTTLIKRTNLEKSPEKLLLRGVSSIVAPGDKFVFEPIPDEETIIVAELNFA